MILEDDGHTSARTAVLDVCGERRIYRDIGGMQATVWVDQTPPSAGGEDHAGGSAASPGARLEEAPAPAAPGVFTSSVRARIDGVASRVLACVGAESATIEATWATSGLVVLRVRGESDEAVSECVAAVVGEIAVPSDTDAGRLLHSVVR